MIWKNIIVFDATNIMFRSFYASSQLWFYNSEWEPTWAIFFFLRTLEKLKQHYDTDKIIFCFDCKESKARRKKILKTYKENRDYSNTEENKFSDLFFQIEEIQKILTDAWYDVLLDKELEADDIAYTVAINLSWQNKVYVVSNDKDYFGMIEENITIIRFDKWEFVEYWQQDFIAEYWEEMNKEKFTDIKAICWDGSDNISWIYKLWIKWALKIIDKYWSIEGWLNSEDWIDLLPKWIRVEAYSFIEKDSNNKWFDTIVETQEDWDTFTIKEKLNANKEVLWLLYSEDERYWPTSLFKVKRDEDKVSLALTRFNIKRVSV